MEELTQRCENLKLSGKEGGEVNIDPKEEDPEMVVVGKFLTKRRINLETVVRTLKPIWKTIESFEVQDADDNTALFVFMNEEDMNKVLWSSPWSYDKYLLVLHRLGVLESVSTLTLEQASIRVQIHGLPMRKQTRDKGERIGGTMGEVEKVDRVERGFSMGKCLRVRVRIDISEPICRGRMVLIGNTSSTWVDLQYEQLPIFCYWPLVAEIGRKETKKEKEAKANVVWSRNQPKPVPTNHPIEAKEAGCSGKRPRETWATSDMAVDGLALPNRVAVDFEAQL
uniref:DUF4283 domain-containing protein n=1 Tax=Quercus lobata TaxID=97700 RepID=A0A7N2MCS5_QUELO